MNTLNTTLTRLPVRVQVAVAHYADYRIEVYRVPNGRYTTKRQCGTESPVELGVNVLTIQAALASTKGMIDLLGGTRRAFEGLDRLLGDIEAPADPVKQRAREDAEGERMGGERWE